MDHNISSSSRPLVEHRRNKSSSVLKSIITSKSLSKSSTKGKENTTPPSSSRSNDPPLHTPIWAEFASTKPTTQLASSASTTKLPLGDRSVEREINIYTPKDYSPSKQRNFHDMQRPQLTKKERPKSDYIPKSTSSISVFDAFTRKNTNDITKSKHRSASRGRQVQEKNTKTTKVPLKSEAGADRATKSTRSTSKDLLTMAKKGTRVMGLVAAFNSKSDAGENDLDPKDIDAQFESVLESRNIPENMRQNLRTLKTTVKANLIRGNEFDLSALGGSSKSAPGSTKDKHPGTPTHRRGISESDFQYETDNEKKSAKRGRTRSKTFTFSKDRSPSKKRKGGSPEESHPLGKNGTIPKSPSMVSLLGGKRGANGEVSKSSVPEDFVSYLRSEQQPDKVEVGKVHRLRQILRNETVTWVETFVKLGGMSEIIGLLHRIMKLEWREEHEDQLLHEALLCLKALCTTDIALDKLRETETSLMPALLGMLFDPEHKGPSEYTTRGIIISILLMHLTVAMKDPEFRVQRARSILGYLSDPLPPEDKRPIPFILDMRQSRPYKVWHREVSNVTREVFWIFLHHHNIVPLPQDNENAASPQSKPAAKLELDLTAEEYTRYFPQPRPPVPAAPYVGGVEWDATNYVAVHLDLLNGLLAALPTKEERNQLREEMRNSGWEKVMGGTLRTCKEKFYDCVHSGLRNWVSAAVADGWEVRDVRMGSKSDPVKSPRKSPTKKVEKPPVLDAPKLDLNLGFEDLKKQSVVTDWI